jgi:hypothetical protein
MAKAIIGRIVYCGYCDKDLNGGLVAPDCLKDAGGNGFCSQECYDRVHNPPHECNQWDGRTGCCTECGEKTFDPDDFEPYEPDDLAQDIANDMV